MVVRGISQGVARGALSLCMFVFFSAEHNFVLQESLPIHPSLSVYIPLLDNCLFTRSNEAFLSPLSLMISIGGFQFT